MWVWLFVSVLPPQFSLLCWCCHLSLAFYVGVARCFHLPARLYHFESSLTNISQKPWYLTRSTRSAEVFWYSISLVLNLYFYEQVWILGPKLIVRFIWFLDRGFKMSDYLRRSLGPKRYSPQCWILYNNLLILDSVYFRTICAITYGKRCHQEVDSCLQEEM